MSTPPIESISFKTKSIYWKPNHFNNILLQNNNGPCFLISLVNSVILSHELKSGGSADSNDDDDDEGWTTVHKKGNNNNNNNNVISTSPNTIKNNNSLDLSIQRTHIKITDNMLVPIKTLLSRSEVKLTDLLAELTSLLLALNQEGDDLTVMLNNLSLLHTGLSINLDFDEGIVDSKKNPVLDICNKLGLKVIHGWLLEENDRPMVLLGIKDYDSLLDLKVQTLDNINQLEVAQEGEEKDDDLASGRKKKLEEQREKVNNINNFLKENGTELTNYGLFQLKTTDSIIKSNEIAIFFRNNHFNTIYKKDDQLYLLLIDEGFKSNKSYNKALVWESLTSINGSTDVLLDGNLLPINEIEQPGSSSSIADLTRANNNNHKISYDDYIINDDNDNNENNETELTKNQDELLALSLQQDEDENYARQLQSKFDDKNSAAKSKELLIKNKGTGGGSSSNVPKKTKKKVKKIVTTTTVIDGKSQKNTLNGKTQVKTGSSSGGKDNCIIM